MHTFILGAAGYIGGAIVQRVLQAGHTVQGLARSDQREATLHERGIVPVRGSLTIMRYWFALHARVMQSFSRSLMVVIYRRRCEFYQLRSTLFCLDMKVLPKRFSLLAVSAHMATLVYARLTRTNRSIRILYSLL